MKQTNAYITRKEWINLIIVLQCILFRILNFIRILNSLIIVQHVDNTMTIIKKDQLENIDKAINLKEIQFTREEEKEQLTTLSGHPD